MSATCTNGLERRFTVPKRAARPSRAALLALSLAAAVVDCTRAAGDSAVRRTGGAADEPFIAASGAADRKSTRLNSSHLVISYAVFCLKKKKTTHSRLYLNYARMTYCQ